MVEEGKQWILKLLLLGDLAVGKTSLVNQYVEHSFTEDYLPTLGVNIIVKDIKIEQIKANVRLILWDIAGQDGYEKTRKSYFEGCAGALFVYDITRHSTFKSIELKWLKDFNDYVKKKGVYVLIGNKVDLTGQRVVSNEEGKELAQKIKASEFIETSAKTGENVEKAFLKLVHQVLSKFGVNYEI